MSAICHLHRREIRGKNVVILEIGSIAEWRSSISFNESGTHLYFNRYKQKFQGYNYSGRNILVANSQVNWQIL